MTNLKNFDSKSHIEKSKLFSFEKAIEMFKEAHNIQNTESLENAENTNSYEFISKLFDLLGSEEMDEDDLNILKLEAITQLKTLSDKYLGNSQISELISKMGLLALQKFGGK